MDADGKLRFAALVEAVADRRDKAAFGELFDFYAPRLKSFLMSQNASAAEAEDLVQDVMTVLWNKAHLYDPSRSSLSTWLFRIARNRRIDLARRQKTRKIDETDPMLLPAAPAAPDDGLAHEDREQVVRAVLAKLPEEQLDLVRQAFFFGLSHSEIAERSGLPLGTVKSRIRLAFGKLRKLLEDAGMTEV